MATKEKEKTEATEHPDYNGQQTEKSPFDILDEVEKEGAFSFSSIGDKAEKELQEEQEEAEGEGTGLKGDKNTRKEESDDDDKGEEEEEENEDDAPDEEQEEEKDEGEENETKDSETPKWLSEKLKAINPDLDLTDKEAVETAIDELSNSKEEADTAKADLEKEREANKSFYDLLGSSDELRNVSRFMFKNKVGFDEALAALDIKPSVDLEKLKKEDPDAYLEAVKAKEKREAEEAERSKKQSERQKQIKENENKSAENTDAFKKEFDLDDQSFNEMTEVVNPMIEDLANGLVTKDLLSVLHKGMTFEDAVAKAKEEGLTEGKNTKIEENARKKRGDNLPNIDSRNPNRPKKEDNDIFSRALKPQGRISDIK